MSSLLRERGPHEKNIGQAHHPRRSYHGPPASRHSSAEGVHGLWLPYQDAAGPARNIPRGTGRGELEVVGLDKIAREMERKLAAIRGIEVQRMVFIHD